MWMLANSISSKLSSEACWGYPEAPLLSPRLNVSEWFVELVDSFEESQWTTGLRAAIKEFEGALFEIIPSEELGRVRLTTLPE